MAQTLDTVVRFPYEVQELFHVPEGNKLYVTAFVRDSGTDHVYVLDCATVAVRREIPTATPSSHGVPRAASCPRHNKVYIEHSAFVPPDTVGLAVIDNATDSVLLRLRLGVSARAIAYNSMRDKLYSATSQPTPGAITSLDCAADTVLATFVPPDYRAGSFAVWDSAGDKISSAVVEGWSNADRVTVMDCRTDSVVAVIRTHIGCPSVAAYNSLRRKLYVGGDGFGAVVIDCAADSVVTRFDSIWCEGQDYVPVYCSAEDKVYWPVMCFSYPPKPDTINVIACASDSVIRTIPTPEGGGGYIACCAYAPWNNRLYVISNGYVPSGTNLLTVFDCRTDSLIGQTQFGKMALEVICNPVDHRIYVSDFWDSAVYVFREDLQPVAEEPEHGSDGLAVRVWPNPARDWLWVRGPGQLILYSASGQRLLALVPGRNRLPDNLAPGVYFVHDEAQAAGLKPQAVHKVVVTR